MARHTYNLEARRRPDGPWVVIRKGVPRGEGLGWLDHHRNQLGPRVPQRLVRSDGRVVDEAGGRARTGLGMVAGHPTVPQYLTAARRVLSDAVAMARREEPGVVLRLEGQVMELDVLLQEVTG